MEEANGAGLEGLTEEQLQAEISSYEAQLRELREQTALLAGLADEQRGRSSSAEEESSLQEALSALKSAAAQTEATLSALRSTLLQTQTLLQPDATSAPLPTATDEDSIQDPRLSPTDDSDMSLSDENDDEEEAVKGGDPHARKTRPQNPRGALCLYTEMGTDGQPRWMYGRVRGVLALSSETATVGVASSSVKEENEEAAVVSAAQALAALPDGLVQSRLFLSALTQERLGEAAETAVTQETGAAAALECLPSSLRLLVVPACPRSTNETLCRGLEGETAGAAAAFQLAAQKCVPSPEDAQEAKESLSSSDVAKEARALAASVGLRFLGPETSLAAALSVAEEASKNKASKNEASKGSWGGGGLLSVTALRQACAFGAGCRKSHGFLLSPKFCSLVGFSAAKSIEARLALKTKDADDAAALEALDGDWPLARGKLVLFRVPRQSVWETGQVRLLFKRNRRRREEGASEGERLSRPSWFLRVGGREVAGEGRRRVFVVSSQSLLPALAVDEAFSRSPAESDASAALAKQTAGREKGEAGSSRSVSEASEGEDEAQDGQPAEETLSEEEALTPEESLQRRRKLLRLEDDFGKEAAASASSMMRRIPRCPRTSWWQPLKSARISRNEVCPLSSPAFFGVWTLHTSGLGLRLLRKWGYRPGECLGRRQRLLQKRQLKEKENTETFAQETPTAAVSSREDSFLLHPLPIEILPHRRSLDFIRSEAEKRKTQKAEAAAEAARRLASRGDAAFDLIRSVGKNVALSEEQDAEAASFLAEENSQTELRAEQRRVHKQFRKAGEEETRAQLSRLEQEERNLLREINAATANCQRHSTGAAGGDPRLRAIYEKKAEELKLQQAALREQKLLLERMLPSKKKLKVSKIF